MPIYEYECRKCKAHTEAFQKVSDKLNKKIESEPKLHRGKKWCWMELESDRDLRLLIDWIGRAYEAAK